MPDKFLVAFEGGGEQDDVPVGEAVGEVELVVASVDEVEVETFDCGVAEGPHEAAVGRVVYLPAQLLVLLHHLAPHHCDITHL